MTAGRDRRHTRGEVGKRTARLFYQTMLAPETLPPADVPPEWAAEAPAAPEHATEAPPAEAASPARPAGGA